MDASVLLNRVSETYRNLRSLTAEATIIGESGDEYSSQRNERRIRFSYAAPDRFRFEPLGDSGVLRVCDGIQIHQLFRREPMPGPRYNSVPAHQGQLPHDFRPGLPFGGGNEPFLFAHINAAVKEAETLPDQDGLRVVSVSYEPGLHPAITTSPVRFWIDPGSFCLMRLQTNTGHRFPTRDEITWTRHTLIMRELRIDVPIPDSTFDFTPPPDAVTLPNGRGIMGGGGGGGFIRGASSGHGGVEHHGSHEWEGETLVERSRWKVRGVMLTFERRMAFAEGNSSVEIVERATGPKGRTETRSSLELG
jgi:outer membrane lipoprotein-sorting protein